MRRRSLLLKPLADLSVLVPLAPGEGAWMALALDLAVLPRGTEVIFAGPEAPRGEPGRAVLDGSVHRIAWVRTPAGRARQLNAALRSARRRFVWILHADTRVSAAATAALDAALAVAPRSLHYFDLAFANDGPALMPLNAAGVWWRSRLLGMPFGDQGFCLERLTALALGGFNEQAPYGEDHLLVWAAHRAGVPLRPTGARLATSARAYAQTGWLRTTTKRVALTYRQAWPELIKLLRDRS